jgi:hypothetical protein
MHATRFGSAKGYSRKNLFDPNRCGYLLAGFAKAPPNAGPTILPIVHIRGMTLKALGCSSFCGTNSATAVLMIPTLPLLRPATALTMIAQARVLEKPKSMNEHIVHVRAMRITGFRPNLSDARPQGIPVRHWEREKTAEVMPAHLAT